MTAGVLGFFYDILTCVHLLFSGITDTKEKEFIFPFPIRCKSAYKNAALCESGVIFYAMSRFFRILFNTPWNIFMSVSETPA